ncbi:MAG: hypothetical protein ACRDQY_23675 [Pseudonocardiaceae bacterium]
MSGPPLAAVVFDYTALLTLGAGNRLLSGLVAQAHLQPGQYVYAPALCLTAAIAQRPGLADHIGVLPVIEVIDLDYAAAASVGSFIATKVDWRAAHAINTSRPDRGRTHRRLGGVSRTGAPARHDHR